MPASQCKMKNVVKNSLYRWCISSLKRKNKLLTKEKRKWIFTTIYILHTGRLESHSLLCVRSFKADVCFIKIQWKYIYCIYLPHTRSIAIFTVGVSEVFFFFFTKGVIIRILFVVVYGVKKDWAHFPRRDLIYSSCWA